MEYRKVNDADVDSWKEVILIYSSALKQISTKLEILNDEFQHVHRYNMIRHVNDIAGIRVICSFTTDIYRIAEMIENQSDINVLSVKDYIKSPKSSGYKSYHMIVSIPIYLSDKTVDAKVEIQIILY